MTTTTIAYKTNEFYNSIIKLGMTEEQKELLEQFKSFIDDRYNDYLIRQRISTKKYHKTSKGKVRNNLAQKTYYEKNKEKIKLKRRQRYKKKKEQERIEKEKQKQKKQD